MSAEEHLLQLAENVPQVVWITDPGLRTLWYVSPAYERVWGRSCKSLYEEPASWLHAIHEHDAPRVRAALAEMLKSGRYEVTYRIHRPDGELRWIADRGTLVKTQNGDPARFVGIADDITDRVNADVKLREAKELAEAADHAKSAFLAAMSHELRTPLTAIIGFSELLEDGTGGPLTEKQEKYVGNILASGRALLDLIDQVLDIARVEAGRLALTLTPVDIGDLLDDVAMLVRPLAAKKNVTLTLAIGDGLPKITADAPKIKQVVFGVMTNALRQAAENGTVRASVRPGVDPGTATEVIEICIADDGPALTSSEREQLLNDHHFVDAAASPPRAGLGMSLALARKLIELHGGRMWLDDSGPGTPVRFTLPLAARTTGTRTSPIEPMRAVANPDHPLVLVVEDDPQASDLLTHYIEAGGYGVARAYTAAQGLAMAASLVPFAITIDPALPDGDGLDLLRALRGRAALAAIPVIIVSVSPPRADVQHVGAEAWILKPVNRAELLGVLRRHRGGQAHGHRLESR